MFLLFLCFSIIFVVVDIVDLEPRPAVRRAVAGLPRLDPGWDRLQGQALHGQDSGDGGGNPKSTSDDLHAFVMITICF